MVDHIEDLAGWRIEVLNPLDLVAEELDPVSGLGVGGVDLQHLPLARNAPRERFWSLRRYCIPTSFRNTSCRSIQSPTLKSCICSR